MDTLKITLELPLKLICTCEACPEQYDVMLGDVEVGYLRLRHGLFFAQCPTVGGDIVYKVVLENSDGCFTDEDKAIHLPAALLAIGGWVILNRTDLI